MVNTKLILIDGITGSGKSTTAQFLAEQVRKNDINVTWYHETQTHHPLGYDEDIEVFHSSDELERFLYVIPRLWEKFVTDVMADDEVHIIESFLLQDTVRILFQNNVDDRIILDFVKKIEAIIEPLNPRLLYFYQKDVEHSVRKIWKRRGSAWKKWFIDSDVLTPYVQESDLSGEHSVIQLWSDYQDFSNQLFKDYSLEKLSIENSNGCWDEYYRIIMNFLELDYKDEATSLSIDQKLNYCGTYKEKGGDMECTIKAINHDIVCDLIWPNIKVLPKPPLDDKTFYLESFPVYIKFNSDDNNSIIGLSLSGLKEEYAGKEFYKI